MSSRKRIDPNSLYGKFMAAFQRLIVHNRATGRSCLELQQMRRKTLLNSPDIPEFTADLKAMIPGFKWSVWEKEMEEVTHLRRQRFDAKLVPPVTTLPQKIADDLAKKYWERLGSPNGRKEIISGVRWGRGHIDFYGSGWNRVVRSRIIGVLEFVNPTGHHCLRLDIPD